MRNGPMPLTLTGFFGSSMRDAQLFFSVRIRTIAFLLDELMELVNLRVILAREVHVSLPKEL